MSSHRAEEEYWPFSEETLQAFVSERDFRLGQSRPGRAGSRLGHVGFPLIAIDFCGAATFRDVPTADVVLLFLSFNITTKFSVAGWCSCRASSKGGPRKIGSNRRIRPQTFGYVER
jgi:hypothetical protein